MNFCNLDLYAFSGFNWLHFKKFGEIKQKKNSTYLDDRETIKNC